MSEILNSALTGEADFASTIFNTQSGEAAPVAEVAPVETPEVKEEAPETPKEKAPEPKAEKKSKATKEEASKAVDEITKKSSSEKVTEKTESQSSDSSEDLPINPHFQDKPVADKPEGDDSEKGIQSWKDIKIEMKKAREERDLIKAELEATK